MKMKSLEIKISKNKNANRIDSRLHFSNLIAIYSSTSLELNSLFNLFYSFLE